MYNNKNIKNVKYYFLLNNDKFLISYLTSADCVLNTQEKILFLILIGIKVEECNIIDNFYKHNISNNLSLKDISNIFNYTHKNIYNFLHNFIDKATNLKIDNIQVFKYIRIQSNKIYYNLTNKFINKLKKNNLYLILPIEYLQLSIDTAYLSILFSSFKRKNIKKLKRNKHFTNKQYTLPIEDVYLNNIFALFTSNKLDNTHNNKSNKVLYNYYLNKFYECLKELFINGLAINGNTELIIHKDKETHKIGIFTDKKEEKNNKIRIKELLQENGYKMKILLKNIDDIYTFFQKHL